jgi:hypothetical protein
MRVLHRPYSMHLLQFMSLKGGCRRLPGARALLSELGQVEVPRLSTGGAYRCRISTSDEAASDHMTVEA